MKPGGLIFAIVIAFALVTGTTAQPYPNRAIRFVAPFAPGGGADTVSRIVAQKLSESLGQQVIVDNRAGTGRAVGSAMVAKSPPDGYTLVAGSPGPLTVSPSLLRDLSYNTLRDLAPITLTSTVPNLLAVDRFIPT